MAVFWDFASCNLADIVYSVSLDPTASIIGVMSKQNMETYPQSGSPPSHWSGQNSALSGLLLHLPQQFRVQFTHHLDD
jgi:hypothetical protein